VAADLRRAETVLRCPAPGGSHPWTRRVPASRWS
jgi:hypothetical protein